jgi:hypothetical protein
MPSNLLEENSDQNTIDLNDRNTMIGKVDWVVHACFVILAKVLME